MSEGLLVLNAGSSSVKFALYGREADGELPLRFRGNLEGIGTRPRLSVEHAAGQKLVDAEPGACAGGRD